MSEVSLTIKFSNADKFTVNATLTDTVIVFKEKISSIISVPTAQQRLIYKGRVLKDELTLASYDVQDGHTIHIVKGISTSSNTPQTQSSTSSNQPSTQQLPQSTIPSNPNVLPNSNPFAAFGALGQVPALGPNGLPDVTRMQDQLLRNPDMMSQILNSPMMDNFLNNPELLQNMMLNNPQMQNMLNSNPHIRQILNDPSVIRQTMETLRNPNALQEAMRSQDLQMSRLENLPGGFNMLRQLYEEVQEPMMEATQSAMRQTPSNTSTNNTSSTPSNPVNSALPNPWAGRGNQNTTNQFPGLGGSNPLAGFNPSAVGGLGGLVPNNMTAMMSNPMFQQMYQQMLNDPQALQQLSQMNPQLGPMLQNPQVRTMLSNPDFLRQMSNPTNLQAMMQMQQAMQTLQQNGFPGIPPTVGFPSAVGGTPASLDFSSLLNNTSAPRSSIQTPNPTQLESPAVRYASQLQQLQAMGFTDDQASLQALVSTGGNINAAVERLLGNM